MSMQAIRRSRMENEYSAPSCMPELSAAEIPSLNRSEKLRGNPDKRQQVIEPTVRTIGAGIGDVAEADSGI